LTERFTVYDVFAVLVPGTVFLLLLAGTLRYLVGITAIEWTGGIGDATVLVVAGYATGVLLQAIGDAVTGSKPWRRWRGGPARVKLLLAEPGRFSEELRVEVLEALVARYGELPPPTDESYERRLREVTYRAFKHVRAGDPTVDRLLAEHHQMRAFMVGFVILAVIAIVSSPLPGPHPCVTHAGAAITYGTLALLLFRRMEKKDTDMANHVLARFIDDTTRSGTNTQPV
jgi:hypothetical protein